MIGDYTSAVKGEPPGCRCGDTAANRMNVVDECPRLTQFESPFVLFLHKLSAVPKDNGMQGLPFSVAMTGLQPVGSSAIALRPV